jgi:hypothetical protein
MINTRPGGLGEIQRERRKRQQGKRETMVPSFVYVFSSSLMALPFGDGPVLFLLERGFV